MSMIGDIYMETYSMTPAATAANSKLTRVIMEEIIAGLGEPTDMTKESMSDLIFAGSSFGQKYGFECGFNYAMALIFESIAG